MSFAKTRRGLQSVDKHWSASSVNHSGTFCFRIRSKDFYNLWTWMLNWDHHLSRLMTKPTKWHLCPAKTQISLGIRTVWSESSLSAWRKLGSSATHWAHSEDSDQTGRMPRLIFWSDWADAQVDLSLRWTHTHFVGFLMTWLILWVMCDVNIAWMM